jgi:hypothetical protein
VPALHVPKYVPEIASPSVDCSKISPRLPRLLELLQNSDLLGTTGLPVVDSPGPNMYAVSRPLLNLTGEDDFTTLKGNLGFAKPIGQFLLHCH